MRKHLWPALLPALVWSKAEARFFDEDALRVDQEEQQGVETINDIHSYRYPMGWSEFFSHSNAAFRISAGSLSANRFEYLEHIRLRSDRQTPYAVGFEQIRHEDYFTHLRQQVVSFDGQAWGPLWIGILGESGSYKEFGDLGGRIALWHDTKNFVELRGWSVDHFYNTKKDEDGASRRPNSDSIELLVSFADSGSGSKASLFAYRDTPLEWRRPANSHVYLYSAEGISTEVSIKPADNQQVTIIGKRDQKMEHKIGQDAFEGQHKKLNRLHDEVELIWEHSFDRSSFATGIANVFRDAAYDQLGLDGGAQRLEPLSPSRVKREEQALHLRYHHPTVAFADYFQWGLFFNRVELQRFEHEREFEVKLQTAWDFRHGENAFALFNVTWDLDRVAENYPYSDASRDFNPWGGGHVQFMMAF
jgi:hypothetical protein